MRFLHTMIRVTDPDATIRFFNLLGLIETRRIESKAGRFTLIFMAADEDFDKQTNRGSAEVELTYNWPADTNVPQQTYSIGRNFGHLAYCVDDVYATCQRLSDAGVTINRPPRDGHMAFVRSPDGISIELLQAGEPLAPYKIWAEMPNIGEW